MNNVGRQLSRSIEHYNRAVGSLERSVLPGARKFVELGMRPKKQLDEPEPLESLTRSIIEGAAENEEDVDPDDAAGDEASMPGEIRPVKPVSGSRAMEAKSNEYANDVLRGRMVLITGDARA